MSSIFSKIIAGDIPCHKIDENEEFLAFLDIMPLAKGHVLVIPKIEVDYIFDIEDDVLSRMMVFAKSVAKKVGSKIACKRIGVAI
ncbi:MAG TPA: HIT family protein, partial [Flavobacteriales bacterium]|nr:HIT family protein [Flavobacteriales bacterium]